MGRRRSNEQPLRVVEVGHGRATRLKRNVETEDPLITILVTTNGQETEITYLSSLLQEPWISKRIIRKQLKFVRAAPDALVRKTAARLNELGYDHAYAVTDTDQFDVEKGLSAAKKARIRLIVSNPCLEAWLIWHYDDCHTHLADGDHAVAKLKKHLPNYSKTNLRFSDYASRIHKAVQIAKKVPDAPYTNPSTTMWMLVEGLMDPDTYDSEQPG